MLKYFPSKLRGNIMVKHHKIIVFLLSTLFTISAYAQESKLDFSSIVNSFMQKNNQLNEITNRAGKQRMLTQRMTKLSLLISLDIKTKKNIKKLKKASKTYADNLAKLQSKNPKITQQLHIIEKLWNPFYKNINNVIQNNEKDTSINYLVEHNKELLQNSNKLVKLFATSDSHLNYLDKAKLTIVNLAGRQRMLLEKMSKEKILILKKNKRYASQLKNSMNTFDMTLKKLKVGDKSQKILGVTNPKLINKLKVIEPLWEELKPLYAKEEIDKKELSKLIRQSSLLLLESNIYVKLTELEREY